MEQYERYIKNHLLNLEQLNIILDEIDGNNSDNDLSKLKKVVFQVAKEKEYIKNNFSIEDISNFSEQLNFFVKQINEKFDNIVQTNKTKQTELKKELEQLGNKRKLANYHR